MQQYTLSVQHELIKNTTVEVSYVGNRGTAFAGSHPSQYAFAARGRSTRYLPGGIRRASSNSDVTYLANQCPFFARQPLPNFSIPGPSQQLLDWLLQLQRRQQSKLEHRGSDLALLSAYTYSKALDDKSAPAGVGSAGAGFAGHMNDLNPSLDYGPSDFSVKHRFVNSAVYSLPVGRGKRFLGGMNKAGDLAIGGWQLSVIATFQTGFPFSINAPDPGAYQSFGMRANQVADPHSGHKSINAWFNTAAFSQPAFGVYGNVGRNTLDAAGNQ